MRKLRTGMMPPDGAPKPAAAARDAFTAALEASLDRAAARAARSRHAGAASSEPRRIRQRHPRSAGARRGRGALLPPDDSAAGFDNIADVLGVSPALIEGYAAAAAQISRLAIGSPSIGLDRATYRVPGDMSQDAHVDGLPLGTRGGIVVRHTFPLDAEYDLQVGQAGGARLGGPPGGRSARRRSLRDDRRRARHAAGARRDAAAGARPARTRSRPPASCAATRPAPTASTTSRRARRASRRSRSPARSTRPARATRRAAGGCSSARPRRRPTSCRARDDPDHAGDARVPPAGGGRRARSSTRCCEFYRAGRQAVVRVRHRARASRGARRSAVPLPLRARAGARSRRARRTASAISSWRRGCRSSCGAAFRTTSCWRWPAGRPEHPATLERQVRRMLADPRADALVTNFAGAVAVPARAAERAARFARLRRQPAAVVPARDGAAVPHHHARGPQHRRSAGRRLHVRGRAPGAALRHSRASAARGCAASRWRPTARGAACSATAASSR